MSDTVTATFKTESAASHALTRLEEAGLTQDQISVVMTDDTYGASFNIDENTKAPEGAATGGALGGLAGGIVAALAATATIAAPGIGLVAAGPLVAGFAGAGAGATLGGILGGLIGATLPEHEAKVYENEIKEGAILIAVRPKDKDQKTRVKDIFREEDAYNIAA